LQPISATTTLSLAETQELIALGKTAIPEAVRPASRIKLLRLLVMIRKLIFLKLVYNSSEVNPIKKRLNLYKLNEGIEMISTKFIIFDQKAWKNWKITLKKTEKGFWMSYSD
jgi:hypothetical protein